MLSVVQITRTRQREGQVRKMVNAKLNNKCPKNKFKKTYRCIAEEEVITRSGDIKTIISIEKTGQVHKNFCMHFKEEIEDMVYQNIDKNERLDFQALGLFMLMANIISNKNNLCYTTQKEISEKCGVSRGTVAKMLCSLIRHGMLKELGRGVYMLSPDYTMQRTVDKRDVLIRMWNGEIHHFDIDREIRKLDERKRDSERENKKKIENIRRENGGLRKKTIVRDENEDVLKDIVLEEEAESKIIHMYREDRRKAIM